MDEIKRISEEEFSLVASEHNFQRKLLLKDYFITLLLYLIKDVERIYFKGGTALNKIFLNHARLSEDIDFTITRDIKNVKLEIAKRVIDSKLFGSITEDKDVDGFLRMVIEYRDFRGDSDKIFIDLNQRGKLILPSEFNKIHHFYTPFIPEFSIKTVAERELIAEKVAAAIGRNKPRDHYDVYRIIHANIPINIDMVKKKCADSGDEFSILKMFNKAKMLKNRWDKDMVSLIAEPISFKEIIKFLAKHFNLKDEKEKSKKHANP